MDDSHDTKNEMAEKELATLAVKPTYAATVDRLCVEIDLLAGTRGRFCPALRILTLRTLELRLRRPCPTAKNL